MESKIPPNEASCPSDNITTQGNTCSSEHQIETLRNGNYELAIMMQYFKNEIQKAISCMESKHPRAMIHSYGILKDALIADFETMKDELNARDAMQ